MAENWEVSKKITRKRWLTATVILCMIPLIYPFMLPIPVSDRTRAFHDQIDALPPGSVLIWGESAADVSTYTNFRTFYWALWDTLCENEIKVIFTSWNTGAHLCGLRAAEERDIEGRYGYEYGKDYVIMPFLAGEESAMAASATDLFSAFATDVRGTPLSAIPMMADIHSMDDADLSIGQYSIFTFGDQYARQFGAKYPDVPLLIIGQYYGIAAYYGTTVFGNVDNTVVAFAEYEYLVGFPGEELAKTEAINTQAFLTLASIVGGVILIRTVWKKEE